MRNFGKILSVLLVASCAQWIAGCEHLSGSHEPSTQLPAAVHSGFTTPATSAPNTDQSKLAVLAGEAAGPGCGWLIGATRENIAAHHTQLAAEANTRAAQQPATASDVEKSDTADLNHDGFVTSDELLAMKRAKLGDAQIIERLRHTNQIYQLTVHQRQYLTDRGIAPSVLEAIVPTTASTSPNRAASAAASR